MNSLEMARSYLEEARVRLETAERALEGGSYAYCVRQCQEAVELSLKAALRAVGVEPPKWHDVGPVMLNELGRFPPWFRERAEELAFISRWLRREREPSMYGDEETGIPPSRLYTRYHAARALADARRVFEAVEMLVGEVGRL